MDIRVKQRDASDCGAACLASVAKYYNLDLQIAGIRQRAGTDKKGTNILGMVEAAKSYGFEAKGVKACMENLSAIPLPAIAHVLIKETTYHYVVIKKVANSYLEIMDPADGKFHKCRYDDFNREWTGALILLVPSDDFWSDVKSGSRFGRFWMFISPYRSVLTQVLFGTLIYTLLGLSTSVFIQKIIDHVIPEGNLRLLNLMGLTMVFLLLLGTLIGFFKSIFILRMGQLIDARLILGYYKHLLKLPQQFFDTMRIGEITSRINDAVKMRIFVNELSINLVAGSFMLLSSLLLMLTYHWKLALIMFLLVPFYSIIYFVANKLNQKSQRKLMEDGAELGSQYVESLTAISTVKRFVLEDHCNTMTETRFAVFSRTAYVSSKNSLFSAISTEFISNFFTIILLWVGADLVIKTQISPGQLLSFYTLTGYFKGPVVALIGSNRGVQDALVAADRLFEIADLDPDELVNKGQIELTPENLGDIRFNHVSFRYGSRTQVFSDLNLEISLGRMTAIIGESGCGKSTVAALIQKIYSLNEGTIFIGGHSINYITQRSLRTIIGVVPQVIDLFSGSILYNITAGTDNINMEKVLTLCTRLGITDFIDRLPDGFRTNIGERGVAVSGGQRQRIAIARTLYRDPEILILDEAASSLDPLSKRYVRDTVEHFLSGGKTVIMIAHELSAVQKADKIILLKDGMVKEQGTHGELMALGCEYYNMWTRNLPENIFEYIKR